MSYPYGPPSGPNPQQPYGQPPPGYGYPPPPDSNLGWGIGAIFLCWPFAIPSLIKATSVSALWAQGQFAAAEQAAADAKKWGKIGIICGCVGYGLIILVYVVLFVVLFGLVGVAGTAGTY